MTTPPFLWRHRLFTHHRSAEGRVVRRIEVLCDAEGQPIRFFLPIGETALPHAPTSLSNASKRTMRGSCIDVSQTTNAFAENLLATSERPRPPPAQTFAHA